MEADEGALVEEIAITEEDAGEVNGEEAVALEERGAAVSEQDDRDGKGGVEAVAFEFEAVEGPEGGTSGGVAGDSADGELEDEDGEEADGPGIGLGDGFDQSDGEEDGHGVVAAGFEFEEGLGTALHADGLGAEDGEDGGGIGGTDNGAKQETFQPGGLEDEVGERADQEGGEGNAEGGEAEALPEDGADGAPVGFESAGEEDEGEGDDADGLGEAGVVKPDASGPVGTGEHPDGDEEEKTGNTKAVREFGSPQRGEQEHGSDEHDRAEGIGGHHSIVSEGGGRGGDGSMMADSVWWSDERGS